MYELLKYGWFKKKFVNEFYPHEQQGSTDINQLYKYINKENVFQYLAENQYKLKKKHIYPILFIFVTKVGDEITWEYKKPFYLKKILPVLEKYAEMKVCFIVLHHNSTTKVKKVKEIDTDLGNIMNDKVIINTQVTVGDPKKPSKWFDGELEKLKWLLNRL
jgi:hypothetical protein